MKNEVVRRLNRELLESEGMAERVKLLETRLEAANDEAETQRQRAELLAADKEIAIEAKNKVNTENGQLLAALEEITASYNEMRPQFEKLSQESILIR